MSLGTGSDRKRAGTGTYLLVTRLRANESIRIGRLGTFGFKRGYYCYVGSAFGPGGIAARLSHHLRRTQSPHWHIDYLRQRADVIETWHAEDHHPREHEWARLLAQMPGMHTSVRRFGASDCNCLTHLYFADNRPCSSQCERLSAELIIAGATVRRT